MYLERVAMPRLRNASLLLSTALALGAQPAPDAARIEAWMRSGTAHEAAGRLEEAGRDYLAARAAAERLGDRERVAEASILLGYLQYTRGEMDDALVNLQRGYELAGGLGKARLQRTALAYIAHVYADAKVAQYDRAIQYYHQLLREHEEAGAAEARADTLFNLASTLERKGDFGAAVDGYHKALAAEQKLGRPQEAAFVQRSIGVVLGKAGRPSEALPLFASSLQVLVAAGDRDRAMMVRQSRGIVLRQLGRLEPAIADLEASRAWFERTGNQRFLERSESELAQALAAAGRWPEAYAARTRHAEIQNALAEKRREEHSARMRARFDLARTEQENQALLREQASARRIRRLQAAVLALSAGVIAALGYLAWRRSRDARRMRDMAMTDELTRLPNRRHLLATGEAALLAARGDGRPLSLIGFDIDHFKRINDTFGHAAGDLVLQRVAHACRGALRPTDAIGRTGGEEFLVVLPATPGAEAARTAERLRAAVEQLDHGDIEAGLKVTISLGVAEWRQGQTLGRLAATADDALYRAKSGGRNRVEVAQEDPA